jgi:hypothetical protein
MRFPAGFFVEGIGAGGGQAARPFHSAHLIRLTRGWKVEASSRALSGVGDRLVPGIEWE